MKFKFIGQSGSKDLDLVIYKIKKPSDVLNYGDIVEVPDDLLELIQRIKISGRYEEVPTFIKKSNKSKGKEKEEKEDG